MIKLTRGPVVAGVCALLTLAVADALRAQDASTATAPGTQTAASQAVPPAPASAPAAPPVEATPPVPQNSTLTIMRPTNNSAISSQASFNFKDASVDAVLNYLSETLGFIVIKDAKIDGRITIESKQSVTPDEAVDMLNDVLKPLNYTALQMGRVLRIVARDQAKKANIPVRFGADPDKIKISEELITQVIPVGTVDAVKLKADLQPLVSSDADVTANAASNTIIVTDSSANIHRIVEIVAALDKHQEAVSDIKIFQLKYANATAAAKLINDIFKQDSSSSSGGNSQQNQIQQFFRARFGGGGPGGPGGPGGGGGSTEGETSAQGKINASADDRTNTLVVSGPTATLKVVDTVVKQLDSNPAADQTFFIYNLKNGQAANLEPVLNTLFGASSGSTGSTSTNNNKSSTGINSGFASSFAGSSGGRSGLGGGSSLGSSGGSFGGFGTQQNTATNTNAARSSVSPQVASAASSMAGQVFVVAAPDTNSLLVTTNSKYADQVKKILDELDRPVPQVLIKVLIAEVTHDNEDDLGVEWSVLDQRPSGKGTFGGSALGIGQSIASVAGAGGPNGLIVQTVEENVTAALKLLATKNKLDVLSRPYILASDNQLASMIVGQEVPIITNSQITDTGQTINSVSYQNVGIILDVTPHINPDGLVILDVAPQVSQLDTGSGVPISSNVTAPIFDIRAAQSRVGIKNGQTIVIGGLMQDQKQSTVSEIPLLGDIPYLGNLFKHTTTKKTKTELLIFLTPHVALQPELLKGMSKEEQSGTKLTPNAVAPGVFQEHLDGMQLGNTAKLGPTTRPAATTIIDIPSGEPQPATQPATEPAEFR
jgi:general secretion pathway protein D